MRGNVAFPQGKEGGGALWWDIVRYYEGNNVITYKVHTKLATICAIVYLLAFYSQEILYTKKKTRDDCNTIKH